MPYPEAVTEIEKLVQDHHETLDEDQQPLVLAIYYHSKSAPNNECLFEVADNFGGNEVSGIGEMTQVDFGPSVKYPLNGHDLRLTLTNPKEYEFATKHQWAELRDVMEAVKHQQAKIVFRKENNPDAAKLTQMLGFSE